LNHDTYVDKAKNSINDQISNINTIVSNLLQLKKTVGTDIDEILSNEVIYQTGNQIISELNYKIKEKQIQVTNNILNTSEVTLPLSTQKLYITLLNLITNAINYSSIGGQIELYTKPDGIYIRDFGTGIDPNIIDKIGQQHIDKIDTSGGSGMGCFW
jgi:signal transduction histidine kinase